MKKGYELLFMAPGTRRHKGKPTLDAIIEIAASCDIHRYTRRVDADSKGFRGHSHSAHFFELADEPEELMFVLGEDRTDALLHAVEAEAVNVFCVRRPIEHCHFGNP